MKQSEGINSMAVQTNDQKDIHTNMNPIKKYIAEQDETIRPRLEDVYKVISDAMPNAEERISWGMPTFWEGRNIIHFAAAKKHIGLYPGPEAIEFFADRLQDYKTSKGAIQLPNNKELPLDLIKDLSRWCYERNMNSHK
ncbi:iron chaperone [Butyrivibrio sp. FCS006]|uniref:iron chaperone n=1 Tax=Butyrivibrio sp. FCS006 TaxID=1280684 RepID=UPI0009DBEE11|nr:DUF1801 domain-containing protein [Butyrivibrio sp. FCS006]